MLNPIQYAVTLLNKEHYHTFDLYLLIKEAREKGCNHFSLSSVHGNDGNYQEITFHFHRDEE